MNKPKLIGIGNNERRNLIVLNKNKSFFYYFPSFFDSLKISMPGSLLAFVSEYSESQKKAVSEDLSEYTDWNEYFRDKEYEVELTYAFKKIFLVINTKPSNRKKIIETLKEVVDFKGF